MINFKFKDLKMNMPWIDKKKRNKLEIKNKIILILLFFRSNKLLLIEEKDNFRYFK